MARGVVLTLAYLGGVLFFLEGVWTFLGIGVTCFGGGCNFVADASRRFPYFALVCLPGLVMIAVAWIICLALLRQAGWRHWFSAALTVPLLLVGTAAFGLISTWNALVARMAEAAAAPGPLDTSYSFSSFMTAIVVAILLMLASDIVVIVSGHKLRRVSHGAMVTPQTTLALAYVGSVLFLAGAAWCYVGAFFTCQMRITCVSNGYSNPTAMQAYMVDFAPFCLPGALLLMTCWLFSLILTARISLWGWFCAVLLLPMGAIWIAGWLMSRAWTDFATHYYRIEGTSYIEPTTPDIYFNWAAGIAEGALLALIAILVIIIAGHALRRADRQRLSLEVSA
ncbi:MAG TPA: hypothetical protein VFX24_02560 [Ktedonobacterales bacterium]|nr:hypothetical protein [Ktedonobacterales bacterium]